MKNKFLKLLLASSSFFIFSTEFVNASLKDQYKSNSACSWDSATYQSEQKTSMLTMVNGTPDYGKKEKYFKRYCITRDKKVLLLEPIGKLPYSGFTYVDETNKNNPTIRKGKVGTSESYWGGDSYYISEWAIEGDKLIVYTCKSQDGKNCAAKLDRYVMATKIGVNTKTEQSTKPSSNYQTIEFKGGKYVGEVSNGKFNGQGTYSWDSGTKYIGNWVNNNMEGKGTMIFANGNKYIGEFKNDKMDGFGKYTWKNGSTLEITFKEDNADGKGKYTFPDGRIKEGIWKNDEFIKWF